MDPNWTYATTTIKLNIAEEDGFLTGGQRNATWLYPERFRADALIYDKFDPNVQYVNLEPKTKKLVALPATEETYVPNVVIRAEAQIDVASPAASTILSLRHAEIPVTSSFAEAKRILHAKALPLAMRTNHATDIVHLWADGLDESTAREVREHLQQWKQRSLTQDAVRWVNGKLAEKPEQIWLGAADVTLRRVRM